MSCESLRSPNGMHRFVKGVCWWCKAPASPPPEPESVPVATSESEAIGCDLCANPAYTPATKDDDGNMMHQRKSSHYWFPCTAPTATLASSRTPLGAGETNKFRECAAEIAKGFGRHGQSEEAWIYSMFSSYGLLPEPSSPSVATGAEELARRIMDHRFSQGGFCCVCSCGWRATTENAAESQWKQWADHFLASLSAASSEPKVCKCGHRLDLHCDDGAHCLYLSDETGYCKCEKFESSSSDELAQRLCGAYWSNPKEWDRLSQNSQERWRRAAMIFTGAASSENTPKLNKQGIYIDIENTPKDGAERKP